MNNLAPAAEVTTLDWQFELDTIAPKGRIGVIALATDFTIEQDLRRMLPEGVEIFTNRIAYKNPTTLENLRAMADDLTRTAEGLLPEVGMDAIIYGCTSGTVAIGEDRIREKIHAAQPGVPVTNPFTAARTALDRLKAKRISILTPYIESVNRAMAEEFTKAGYEVINITGLGFENDVHMAGIPLDSIYEAGIKACHPEADALFISCTAPRSSLVINRLEMQLEKPVITSNQAIAWHALKLIGCKDNVSGFGRIFSHL